ncbi:cell division protein PerM, partial [Microbacterium ulmi]
MHRLIVAFLAAFDAVIAAAVGVAATLAPLTLLWIFGFGGAAPWSLLWPASASVWQLGHLVPLHIALPPEYLAATGIAQDAASFVLSLAPLAFAGFTAIFAARSGARASRADAWITGVVVGTVVFGVLAALVAVTARNGLAAVFLWQAVLLPVVVFAVPAVVGAVVTEWREAGAGIVARVRDRVEVAPRGWGAAPALVVRGAGVVLGGLVGAGALVVAIAAVAGGDDVIALFEAGNVDLVGIVVVALGQLAYLPTLVVWGMSFVAGPGFAVGVGTSVSPSGTQLGVVPGIPVLGALPESTSTWLLLVALVPVALGAFAGWIARSRLVATEPRDHEPALARAAIAAGIAV